MAVSFFDSFTPQEVARISAAGTAVKVPEGWSPIWERTPADKAYIVLDGTVSVRRGGEEIAQLGPGEIIGEAAIVNDSLRTASIVALTPLELIHFTDEAVRRLCDEIPSFATARAPPPTSASAGLSERTYDPAAPDDSGAVELPDLADALEVVEGFLLGEQPSLTRVQVAERAGVPLEVAEQLWRLLGFPNQTDDAVAFTEADV